MNPLSSFFKGNSVGADKNKNIIICEPKASRKLSRLFSKGSVCGDQHMMIDSTTNEAVTHNISNHCNTPTLQSASSPPKTQRRHEAAKQHHNHQHTLRHRSCSPQEPVATTTKRTRPKAERRNSNRSVVTAATECSTVSFTSTKLGQKLIKRGFKIEKDFEIDAAAATTTTTNNDNNSNSPRQPREVSRPRANTYSKREAREPCSSPVNLRDDNQSRTRTTTGGSCDLEASFSETKLGKLLSQRGFHIENDFEVESISPTAAAATTTTTVKSTPRRRRSSVSASTTTASRQQQQSSSRRTQGSSFDNSFSERKRGQRLRKRSSKVEEEDFEEEESISPPAALDVPPRISVRHGSLLADDVPLELSNHSDDHKHNFSDSEVSPITMGDDSLSYMMMGHHPEVLENFTPVKESVPMKEGQHDVVEDFIPVKDRVPVEELLQRAKGKQASRKAIIEKLRMIDTKLGKVLDGCQETSRKLKELDESLVIPPSFSSGSEFSDLSDWS